MHQVGKTRSKTGCRTCRMRKVKCDEEKNRVQGLAEPQCKRCKSARIRCEWKGGPIPRKRTGTSSPISQKPRSKSQQLNHDGGNEYDWKSPNVEPHDVQGDGALLSPLQRIDTEQPSVCLEAANSLKITAVDRECIDYLRTSTLVIVLGKHWPWSTVSYAYHKIAVTQPMVMSMILASTAREIHRLRVSDDQCFLSDSSAYEPFELSGQAHYGQALWALRQALKEDVKSPQDIEAIFITLWLIIDYENRFGGGEPAIHIHIRGIETMFHNHVAPLLHSIPHSPGSSIVLPSPTSASLQLQMPEDRISEDIDWVSLEDPYLTRTANLSPAQISLDGLSSTSVPLFLLWTLYFFTPSAHAFGPGISGVDTDIFRFFLGAGSRTKGRLTLSDLYRISRQSASRFWGEDYPLSAQLDELENLPGLTLYHRSHVIQFRITELFNRGPTVDTDIQGSSQYQCLVDDIHILTSEYDTVLTTARLTSSCDTGGDGRRVLETVYWASITYYSMIVYFQLCFQDIFTGRRNQKTNNIMSLRDAVSQVLELSLKLYRSRPRLMARISWPLFIAGIATSDRIYQDWVSIRLRELGRYGQNYARMSEKYDEVIRAGAPNIHRVISTVLGS